MCLILIDTHRFLYQEALVAVLPASRKVIGNTVKIGDLANERFILFHRKGSPTVFDAILKLCKESGFVPGVDSQPELVQLVYALVAAEQGVAILPSSAYSSRIEGVKICRLEPDHIRFDMVLAWPEGSNGALLDSFVDLVQKNREYIEFRASHDARFERDEVS